MSTLVPVYKDIVLVGGGHSHVEVLRRFGLKPPQGVRLTVISPTLAAPYSGMIPGYVSGFYSLTDCHIDLCRLARHANARLILSSATGIDLKRQRVILEGSRPPIDYDILSINVGITPAVHGVPGAWEYTTPVKPISTFASKLEKIIEKATRNEGIFHISVVGGGAGGVELACALQYRLEGLIGTGHVEVTLVSRGDILSGLTPSARQAMIPLLIKNGIKLKECANGVEKVEQNMLLLADGDSIFFDECLWCTQAGAPDWLKQTGLPVDDDGFLLVNEYLQSAGGPSNVFAAGDCVTSVASPRPKAGVYAVRAGPYLTDNIERSLHGRTLKPWYPQSSHLNLISCGGRYALAVKSWFVFHAAWLWTWKDRIDRNFMDMYGEKLSAMGNNTMQLQYIKDSPPLDNEAKKLIEKASMRCGACGSKVGSSILQSTLARISQRIADRTGQTVVHWGDDAATLPAIPSGCSYVQTMDFFKAPFALQDPYIFGYIAAVHAMSDCYAMNANPMSALGLVVLPFQSTRKTEHDMYQMLSGAVDALLEAECSLIGGHTSEGADMSMGLSVTGATEQGMDVWRKSGAQIGDDIILVKPLGTGTILAAADGGIPVGAYLEEAINVMCISNMYAMRTMRQCQGISSCTDVTGFGLLGHLAEILEASSVSCELHVDAMPLIDGVQECIALGVQSSLLESNVGHVESMIQGIDEAKKEGIFEALVDPQTNGGLLFTINPTYTQECLSQLCSNGYNSQATSIGKVVACESSSPFIRFLKTL